MCKSFMRLSKNAIKRAEKAMIVFLLKVIDLKLSKSFLCLCNRSSLNPVLIVRLDPIAPLQNMRTNLKNYKKSSDIDLCNVFFTNFLGYTLL